MLQHARTTSRRTRWSWPAVLLAVLAACTTEDAVARFQRTAGKPVRAIDTLLAGELSPREAARRLGNITDDLLACAHAETQRGRRPFARATRLAGDELGRTVHIRDRLASVPGTELARWHGLTDLKGALAPADAAVRLRHIAASLPYTLQMDRRALGESTDPEHRTDPADVSPPMSLGERLLRRLWR
jgi:hypothetical protein